MLVTTCLVMGAGGFIGQHLIKGLLNKRKSVIAIGHDIDKLNAHNDLALVSGEISSSLLDAIPVPDFIYFLLGGSSVASSINEPVNDFNKTFQPLILIMEKLKSDWKGGQLIFISSAAVYGENASQHTSIKTECKPLSVYGLHKLLAEQYIEFYKETYSISAKIIRPFSIYGPGLKKQLIWDALCKIANNQHEYFGSGLEERDWLHVSDLVDILVEVIEKFDNFPSVINAGYGQGVKIKEIITLLYEINDVNQHPIFVNKNKVGDPQHLVCDADEQSFMPTFRHDLLRQRLREVSLWFDSLNSNK